MTGNGGCSDPPCPETLGSLHSLITARFSNQIFTFPLWALLSITIWKQNTNRAKLTILRGLNVSFVWKQRDESCSDNLHLNLLWCGRCSSLGSRCWWWSVYWWPSVGTGWWRWSTWNKRRTSMKPGTISKQIRERMWPSSDTAAQRRLASKDRNHEKDEALLVELECEILVAVGELSLWDRERIHADAVWKRSRQAGRSG